MPTLIDMRRRIKSVKNTQKITKAMKTVSSAKFRKAQRSVVEGRPYWHNSPALLAWISRWAGSSAHPLFDVRDEKKILMIVITSDKGLCGAFNSNLLTKALEFIEERRHSSRVSLMLVGKKAVNFFKKQPYPVEWAFAGKTEKIGALELRQIAGRLIRLYAFQETDGVYMAYNEFKSVLAPRLSVVKLLPVVPDQSAAAPEAGAPDWEPAAAMFLETLISRYVEAQLGHAFSESQAAEQAARMMAMENASKNAGDLIRDLVLDMNKIRQAGITKELLEIMTAVEALKE